MYLIWRCHFILTSNARRAPCSSSLASRHRKKYCVKGDKRSFWTFLKKKTKKNKKNQQSFDYHKCLAFIYRVRTYFLEKVWIAVILQQCDPTANLFCHFVDETLSPFVVTFESISFKRIRNYSRKLRNSSTSTISWTLQELENNAEE